MVTHIDAVCGMQVSEQNAVGRSEYQGKTYYFCSQACQKRFDQDPEQYVHSAARRAEEWAPWSE